MKTPEIRKTFLDFFAERGHTIVPSSSLVPDDPTLFFTNAGMVQFKPYFLGEKTPPYRRAASVQKCMRAGGKDTDLETVGKNTRTLSLFEMQGNFSFGDYFKSEACLWGYELVTGPYGLDPERIWITVFETDDEAAKIWEEEVGIRPGRIIRRGREHGNFWDMGVGGPCGPCSEILYDRGESFGEEYTPGRELNEERYLEIWNLVFMNLIQNDDLEITGELPTRNIDTGMGLERFAAALQDVPTVFDIDSMATLLEAAGDITGHRYHENEESDVALRVIADHSRAMSFLIADGVLPANEFRGYVLRRLIRRAIWHARKLNYDEAFLTRVTDVVIDLYKDAYPEVERGHDLIERVIQKEEARFDITLRQGLGLLMSEIGQVKAGGGSSISGKVAFRLHDTYGFPLDLTVDIAEEEGLKVDEPSFQALMGEQRARARAARKADLVIEQAEEIFTQLFERAGKTEFLGYESFTATGTVTALVKDRVGTEILAEGESGELILDRTTFYAESGGQIADRGEIRTETGAFTVTDVQFGIPGLIVHEGKVTSGEIRVGQDATTHVDPSHREGVRQSHTATHILHWALRNSLGDHAKQQGSLVEPGRLRFDFSHYEAVPDDHLAEIEEEINRRALHDDSVRAFETTFDYARSIGAMALFGEKYGDVVRVVEVGEYSKELCGGTHVAHTGQIGVVKLTGEGSVAAGTRRVEAFTGLHGLQYLNERARMLDEAARLLKVDPEKVTERLTKMHETIRSLESELSKIRSAGQRREIEEILNSDAVRPVGDHKLVVLRRPGEAVDELRKLAIALRDALGSSVVVIGAVSDGKANIIATSSRDLVERGVSAKDLLSAGARRLGGGAGGPPDLAIAGGPNADEFEAAMEEVIADATNTLHGR